MRWIELRLREIGRPKKYLAEHLAIPSARITELIKGTRKLQAAEVRPLAKALDLNVDVVLDMLAEGPKGVDNEVD